MLNLLKLQNCMLICSKLVEMNSKKHFYILLELQSQHVFVSGHPIRTRTSFSTFMGQKHVELCAQRIAFLYLTPPPRPFN